MLVEKVFKKIQGSVLNLEGKLNCEKNRKRNDKFITKILQEAVMEAKLNVFEGYLENLMHNANDITSDLI